MRHVRWKMFCRFWCRSWIARIPRSCGFDFRSDANVLLKRVTLDAYYQSDTLPSSAPEAQVILYDDVVIATARIGCRVP